MLYGLLLLSPTEFPFSSTAEDAGWKIGSRQIGQVWASSEDMLFVGVVVVVVVVGWCVWKTNKQGLGF